MSVKDSLFRKQRSPIWAVIGILALLAAMFIWFNLSAPKAGAYVVRHHPEWNVKVHFQGRLLVDRRGVVVTSSSHLWDEGNHAVTRAVAGVCQGPAECCWISQHTWHVSAPAGAAAWYKPAYDIRWCANGAWITSWSRNACLSNGGSWSWIPPCSHWHQAVRHVAGVINLDGRMGWQYKNPGKEVTIRSPWFSYHVNNTGGVIGTFNPDCNCGS
jgi:hypothetical protein